MTDHAVSCVVSHASASRATISQRTTFGISSLSGMTSTSACSTMAVERVSVFQFRTSRLSSSQCVPVALTMALLVRSDISVSTRLSCGSMRYSVMARNARA